MFDALADTTAAMVNLRTAYVEFDQVVGQSEKETAAKSRCANARADATGGASRLLVLGLEP